MTVDITSTQPVRCQHTGARTDLRRVGLEPLYPSRLAFGITMPHSEPFLIEFSARQEVWPWLQAAPRGRPAPAGESRSVCAGGLRRRGVRGAETVAYDEGQHARDDHGSPCQHRRESTNKTTRARSGRTPHHQRIPHRSITRITLCHSGPSDDWSPCAFRAVPDRRSVLTLGLGDVWLAIASGCSRTGCGTIGRSCSRRRSRAGRRPR